MLFYSPFSTFLWWLHLGNSLKCIAFLSCPTSSVARHFLAFHHRHSIGSYSIKSCDCCSNRSGTQRPNSSLSYLLVLMFFFSMLFSSIFKTGWVNYNYWQTFHHCLTITLGSLGLCQIVHSHIKRNWYHYLLQTVFKAHLLASFQPPQLLLQSALVTPWILILPFLGWLQYPTTELELLLRGFLTFPLQ